MKSYITPTLTSKGNTVELTKFIVAQPLEDGSGDPRDGMGAVASVGFLL